VSLDGLLPVVVPPVEHASRIVGSDDSIAPATAVRFTNSRREIRSITTSLEVETSSVSGLERSSNIGHGPAARQEWPRCALCALPVSSVTSTQRRSAAARSIVSHTACTAAPWAKSGSQGPSGQASIRSPR